MLHAALHSHCTFGFAGMCVTLVTLVHLQFAYAEWLRYKAKGQPLELSQQAFQW